MSDQVFPADDFESEAAAVVAAADQIAEATEEQRAEGANREAGSEAEQHEDELRRVIGARHEGRGNVRSERAREIEVVPFEDRTGGRSDNNLTLFGGHRPGLGGRCRCHAHLCFPLYLNHPTNAVSDVSHRAARVPLKRGSPSRSRRAFLLFQAPLMVRMPDDAQARQ